MLEEWLWERVSAGVLVAKPDTALARRSDRKIFRPRGINVTNAESSEMGIPKPAAPKSAARRPRVPRPAVISQTAVISRSRAQPRRPFVIDFHAHVTVPEVVAFSKGHVVNTAVLEIPGASKKVIEDWTKWRESLRVRLVDPQVRLREMDKMGVDVQVLTASLVHMYTYWADSETSLKMERLANDRIAAMVAVAPDRFVGLGGVPLQDPAAALGELRRCMGELKLRGVQISSHAESMELGDPLLRPFWAEAEKLGAALYVHPAGVVEPRYRKFQLWNSIGQPLEEALAMASLFYEGVLDAYPKLKLCIAHGGGYLPYYAGRVDRNFREKWFTRTNMKKSPTEYMKKNFWYDSCVYNPDMLEFLVRKVGASRIVLGSDYPVGEADPVGFIRKARGLSAADKENILGRTAAKLLGLSI